MSALAKKPKNPAGARPKRGKKQAEAKKQAAKTPQNTQRPAREREPQRAPGGVPPPEAFERVRHLPPPDLPRRSVPPPAAPGTPGAGHAAREDGRRAKKPGNKARRQGAQKAKEAPKPKTPPKKRKPANPARRRFQRRAAAALLIAGLIAGGVMLSVNLLFKIKTFELEGAVPYTVEQVAAAFGHGEGDNMYGFSAANAAERVAQSLPYIESVDIRRRLPSTIVFKATAAVERYYLAFEEGYAVLSTQRKVLHLVDDAPEGLVRIDGLDGLAAAPGLPLALTEAAEKLSASQPRDSSAGGASLAAAPLASAASSAPESGDAEPGAGENAEETSETDADSADAGSSAAPPEEAAPAQGGTGAEATPAERFGAMVLLLDALEAFGLEDVTWVDVGDPLALRFCWENRIVVALGPRSNMEEKMRAAVVLLTDTAQGMIDSKEAGTLDMTYYISTGRSVFSPE